VTVTGVRDVSPPLLAGAAAAFGCAWVAAQDPYQAGSVLPVCPTALLTGLQCPACGGLRMTRSLLQGDIRGAAAANLLLLALIPAVVVGWLLWWRAAARREDPPVIGRRTAWGLLAVAVVWTVVRNVG
jgi:hypothetical protein